MLRKLITTEQWQLLYIPKNKDTKTEPKSIKGDINNICGNVEEPKCFDCLRVGHVIKDCTFATKEDGSPLNTPEEKKRMYNDYAKEKRKKECTAKKGTKGRDVDRSTNFTDTDIVSNVPEDLPTFERSPLAEDKFSFNIKGVIINRNKAEIQVDLGDTKLVYNSAPKQTVTALDRLFEVLLDNQSTCDVFINTILLRNIRRSDWTLVLTTLAGKCRFTMIGDLLGVGTIWYYPQGSTNVFSRHQMMTQSKWNVYYNSDKYHETGNEDDLVEQVCTKEGREFDFKPTPAGLHVLGCTSFSGANKSSHVFGTTIIDNGTKFGAAMNGNTLVTHEVFAGVSDKDDAISTVENSKSKFTV